VDSSSSDVGHTARNKSPRKKRLESEQPTTDKLDQSDVTLDVSARDDGTESEELVKQLQTVSSVISCTVCRSSNEVTYCYYCRTTSLLAGL